MIVGGVLILARNAYCIFLINDRDVCRVSLKHWTATYIFYCRNETISDLLTDVTFSAVFGIDEHFILSNITQSEPRVLYQGMLLSKEVMKRKKGFIISFQFHDR